MVADVRFQRLDGILRIVGFSWLFFGVFYLATARPLTGLIDLVVGVFQVGLWWVFQRRLVSVPLAHKLTLALDAMQTTGYDVVLMDLHMPRMDGLETVRRMRETLPAAHQPFVVVATADVLPESRAACVEVGVDAIVTKPVRLGPLSAVLRGVTREAS